MSQEARCSHDVHIVLADFAMSLSYHCVLISTTDLKLNLTVIWSLDVPAQHISVRFIGANVEDNPT